MTLTCTTLIKSLTAIALLGGSAAALASMGFGLTDPGRFQSGTQDFSAQISAFKNANVEIVTGVIIPPDAKTFLTQARQQGFKPKAVSLGKALMHPLAIEALGDLGEGLTTEMWWSPTTSKTPLPPPNCRPWLATSPGVAKAPSKTSARLPWCWVNGARKTASATT